MTVALQTRGTGQLEPSTALLAVGNLEVSFPAPRGERVHALRGITFNLGRGESLALVGESGSGKSTTAMALIRLLPRAADVTATSLLFDGLDLMAAGPRELQQTRGAKIGFVFQDPQSSLNPVLTIGAQVTEGLRRHLRLSASAASERAKDLLAQVGIPDPAGTLRLFPHQLSGGMRQRVVIAIAVSCNPSLLIADEPTSALDVTVQAQVLRLIDRLRREIGMSVVFITHDLGVAAKIADRVLVMYGGRIVEQGPTRQVLARPTHPYTLGLLQSRPRLDLPRAATLQAIPGAPLDPLTTPTGCAFAARCTYRVPKCEVERPDLRAVVGSVEAACWMAPIEPHAFAGPADTR